MKQVEVQQLHIIPVEVQIRNTQQSGKQVKTQQPLIIRL